MFPSADKMVHEDPHQFAGLDTLASISCEKRSSESANVLTDEALQHALGKLVTIYAAKFENGNRTLPIDPAAVNATSVLIAATMMLKAANIELFEMAMWQAFSGVK